MSGQDVYTATLQHCSAAGMRRKHLRTQMSKEKKKTTTKNKVLPGDSLRAAPRSRVTAAAPPACGHLNSTGEFTAVRLSHSLTASLCKECRVSTSALSGSHKHGLVIILTFGADSLAPPPPPPQPHIWARVNLFGIVKNRRRWECERKGSPGCRRSLSACWGW